MTELSIEILASTRKNERAILQRLAEVGQVHVAEAMNTSESTVSRMKDGEISKLSLLLAACGLKVVAADSLDVSKDEVKAMKTLAYKYLEMELGGTHE